MAEGRLVAHAEEAIGFDREPHAFAHDVGHAHAGGFAQKDDREAAPPAGVRSDPAPDGQGLTTLCTLVADLTAGQAVIAARDGQPVTIPLADLAAGLHPG